LDDPEIAASRADEIVQSVFAIFGKGIHENISRKEIVGLLEAGRDLPDCEFDGHHGDEEWEVHFSTDCTLNWTCVDGSLIYIMWNNFIWMMIAMNRNGIILRISVLSHFTQLT
jgi:hypothetical protein